MCKAAPPHDPNARYFSLAPLGSTVRELTSEEKQQLAARKDAREELKLKSKLSVDPEQDAQTLTTVAKDEEKGSNEMKPKSADV